LSVLFTVASARKTALGSGNWFHVRPAAPASHDSSFVGSFSGFILRTVKKVILNDKVKLAIPPPGVLLKAVIRVLDLWKFYSKDGQENMAALRGTSLEVQPGEVVALYGKSGSGKTTLLNILAGIDRPSRGLVEVDGLNLEALGESRRTRLRRERIGFIFQFFNLLPTLTVFENVCLSLELAGRSETDPAREALRAVGLEGKEDRFPHELSGGEQQRVAIARAIVKEPAIILADEPTGNLDTQTGGQVLALLSARCREFGTSLLMATHSPLTCRYSDRMLRMVDGRVVEETGCPETRG
jgi:putative ABC transport system ATP-binding protein